MAEVCAGATCGNVPADGADGGVVAPCGGVGGVGGVGGGFAATVSVITTAPLLASSRRVLFLHRNERPDHADVRGLRLAHVIDLQPVAGRGAVRCVDARDVVPFRQLLVDPD